MEHGLEQDALCWLEGIQGEPEEFEIASTSGLHSLVRRNLVASPAACLGHSCTGAFYRRLDQAATQMGKTERHTVRRCCDKHLQVAAIHGRLEDGLLLWGSAHHLSVDMFRPAPSSGKGTHRCHHVPNAWLDIASQASPDLEPSEAPRAHSHSRPRYSSLPIDL